ncbi:BAG family molecular chaperone regulator [Acinetobacter radioresistens]|uniref:BAG family molecular chaperone regulator n=1 Tax=Acinetobacter radioresistens TaxID=40216 RepID=UPI002005DC06|nr:BAG family molecular chaperone regulator [Acinetobacter radioresistens]MCK4108898.1 hypothetical protein [Acinetobacter radioresistens]
MTDCLILTMTDAGCLSMLNYLESGFNIEFSHLGLGSGNYSHDTKTEDMVQKWADFPLLGGVVDPDNHCLIFNAMGQLADVHKISEIGLYDKKGTLFAVVAKPNGYFFKTEPNTFFSLNISVALDQKIEQKKINLAFAPQEQILSALLKLHLQHKNTHPQYKVHMASLLKMHLDAIDPHNSYTTREEAVAFIQKYLDYLDRIADLFLQLFDRPVYAGCSVMATSQKGQEIITLPENFKGNLANTTYAVFLTPEAAHEAWNFTRTENRVNANVYSREGTGTKAYLGKLNWLALSDASEAPITELAIPEIISVGVLSAYGEGFITVEPPRDKTVNLSKAVFLVSPEGQHEGWSSTRSPTSITSRIFTRSDKTRRAYSGNASYALLEPKSGKDLAKPNVFPALLMCGVNTAVNNTVLIQRPAGQTWDLNSPNIAIIVNPDGENEGWEIIRQPDQILVRVYNRNELNTTNYNGLVNWAIFQVEQEPDLYRAGTYDIIIPANSQAEIHLVGSGGSGAGSLWASDISGAWLKMAAGGDTTFIIGDEVHLVAGAGQGGYRGVWNNGSAYIQGVAGEGGKAKIQKLGKASILSQSDGQKAFLETAHDWCNRDTRGGLSTYKYGAGGEGGYTVETRKHRCYGAGGGSGAHIGFKYRNISNLPITAKLVVGNFGAPDTVVPEVNNGKSGEAGCATVQIGPL